MINIKKASISDSGAVLDLTLNQFQEHEIICSREVLRYVIEAIISDESQGFFLLARVDGEVIGLAAVSFSWVLEHGGKSAWLDELFVLPEYRDKGVGSRLLDDALKIAKQAGCLAIDLEVEEDHRRAEGLYKRRGFIPLERTRYVKRFD